MSKARPEETLARDVELALQLDGYHDEWATSEFVEQLHSVERQVQRLVAVAPARAAELYETMIGDAHEAAESVDDSCGELAAFVEAAFNPPNASERARSRWTKATSAESEKGTR